MSLEVNGENSKTFGVGKPQREIDPFRDELVALRSALGNRIRELRKAKGWSQEQFSAYAHVHRTFAGALEREQCSRLARHANRSESEAISTAQVLDAGSARQLWISS